MRKIELGKTGLSVPAVAVGMMRLTSLDKNQAESFIKTAMENGANFFDHADIYGRGECETIFSEAVLMNSSIREKMIIQTKCGIVPGKMYDFSKEHIVSSVNKSLERLNTDYIDVLLLHRPDALCEPEEVAEAFDELKSSGKVKHFGLSNHNPMQIELLKKSVNVPLSVNQMQLSIMHCPMITFGMNINNCNDNAVNRDGSVLDYCRLNDITVQAWSPFQSGMFGGCFVDDERYPELNKTLQEVADKYGVSKTTVSLAWILRHPAKIQPVTGTMNNAHLLDCLKAAEVNLSREDWYSILSAAGNRLL